MEWIPITFRDLDDNERECYPDYITQMYDCKLPVDGEEVLVTTSCGYVTADIFYNDGDDGCVFENYDEVIAWMPFPEPYKENNI